MLMAEFAPSRYLRSVWYGIPDLDASQDLFRSFSRIIRLM